MDDHQIVKYEADFASERETALVKLFSGERPNSSFTFFPDEMAKLVSVFANFNSAEFAQRVIQENLDKGMRFFHELWARGITEALEGNEFLIGLIKACKEIGLDLQQMFSVEYKEVVAIFQSNNVPQKEQGAFFDYLERLNLLTIAADTPA